MKRKIFIEGKNQNERAYIGWENKSLSLQGIKMGYKNSADSLVEIALNEGKKDRIDILDTYIFPILFLYRHSIEISLKHIYFRAKGSIPKGGHNLLNLWDRIDKEVFKLIGLNCFNEKHDIKELLKELQGKSKDEKGDVWRYLIDRNGKLYFEEWDYIDYKNLKETLSWLYEQLDVLYDYVDHMLSV